MTTARPAGADIIRPLAPWGATTRRAVRRGDLWSPVICWGIPRGRAAFLKVASLDFYRKRPRRLRRGGRPHFFPKKWGERRARGSAPWIPPNGGSWRRWAVRTGQKPTAHCRPLRRHKFQIIRFTASGKARSLHCASSPHRTRFAGLRRGPRNDHRYRRCRAPGGTHRDYPASPDGRCAVLGAPAGPPGGWSGCGGPAPAAAVEFFVLVTVTFWRTAPAGPPRGGSRRSSGGAAPRPARWPARRPGRCPPARPGRRARRSCRRYTRS